LLTIDQYDSDGATITFKDEKIETGSVIGLALHYIDKRQVDKDRGPTRMVSVLKFSGKWQIACIPERVQAWIQTLADQSEKFDRMLDCSHLAMLLGSPALSSQLHDTAITRRENLKGNQDEDELEDMLEEYHDTISPRTEFYRVIAHDKAVLGEILYDYLSVLPPLFMWLLSDDIGLGRRDDRRAKFEAMAAEMCESSIYCTTST
jgi:hypothetical protein